MTGTNRLLQDTVDDLARAGWGAREFYVTLAEFERAVRQPPWYAWLRYAGVLLAAASLFLILWITLKDDCKRQVEEAKRENARLRPDGTAVTHADLKLIADRLVVLEKAPPKGQEFALAKSMTEVKTRLSDLQKEVKGLKQGDQRKPAEPAKGHAILLGTYTWDIETNKQGGVKGEESLQWEIDNEENQFLAPQNGAGLVVLGKRAFDKISREDLANLKYSDKKVANTSLTPGTVLALRTKEGNYVKLRVVGYREAHDFSFPEAKLRDAKSRALLQKRPNMKNYNMEVEWVLYQK